ncbi:MAG TPA: hypothetical protein VM940_03680 [Chthoniobacterales bacterium]|jgi:hypothetical protein|nr:hypothetical protein [Chthoniobacterales bacterium]
MPDLRDFTGSIAIVISSCDAFFDTWRPFVYFFSKYWPDCPFRAHLVINSLRVRSNILHPIAVGPDNDWASNMAIALGQIPHSHILYFQEDYFLTGPVRTQQLASDIAYAFERDAASFCFYGRSRLEDNFEAINERFGVVPPDSDGRTRLQVTLWKKSVLQSALRPGETAWNMEARGSERTRDLLTLSYSGQDGVPIPYLMSAISRRLWTQEALDLCEQAGVKIEPRIRSTLTHVPWRRRFRRGLDRTRLWMALARQNETPLNIDPPPG